MNKILTVIKYELKDYFSSKAFVIITLFLALMGSLATFAPRVIDLSNITGVKVVEREKKVSEKDISRNTFLYIDETGYLKEDILPEAFPGSTWQKAESAVEISTAVKEKEAGAGFVVTAADSYDYYLYNNNLMDKNRERFDEVMKQVCRLKYCDENGIDPEKMQEIINVSIHVNEKTLNKDSAGNYLYCTILVFIVFYLILYYGQMIATSVTSEKSNRAIEVLVTSTTSNSLLFGKVIAGAVAGLLQVGIIMGSIFAAYKFNSAVWGGILDMVLNIPGNILLAFAAFGMGGYLFYMFLFGAMGAMVSKTEDVSKSTGGLMILLMVVYWISSMQLRNPESSLIKILSFLPFSSYSTMFTRIGMGTVAFWEIALSFVILVVSIIGVGILGAKLYRMGTLQYGNPIKLSTALKNLKNSD